MFAGAGVLAAMCLTILAASCRPPQVVVYSIPRDTEPPEHWRLAASAGPEKQRYLIRDQNGTATVTLTVLAGDGGGLLANVNRWRKQLNLDPATEDQLKTLVPAVSFGESSARLMEANGTDFRDGTPALTLGLVAGDATLTWFYKLMGDPEIVRREREAFLRLAPQWR